MKTWLRKRTISRGALLAGYVLVASHFAARLGWFTVSGFLFVSAIALAAVSR